MNRKTIIITSCVVGIVLRSLISHGQSSLSVSVPMIWSNVKVKDNWTPPTAPNYKEYLIGTAFGSGINFNYSFQPKFISNNRYKHLAINVGAGYFKQEFNIRRAFDYASMIYIIYRTKNYIYYNWCWTLGLAYSYSINNHYSIVTTFSYNQFTSFQQNYTPTTGDPTQVNKRNIEFGRMAILSLGIKRNIWDKFAIELNVLLPYTSWRNDKIFRDDPKTFSHPSCILGGSISVVYRFVE